MTNQNCGWVLGSAAGEKSTKSAMAMHPYIPSCNAMSDRVSALSAATNPSLAVRFCIGLIVKYWKAMPRQKATMKSASQLP